MSYAKASDCVPEPCTVIGTPLKPFCLGHHLLLIRLGSPLAENPLAEMDPDGLLQAISICANSYEATLSSMLNGDWPGMFADWLKRANRIRRWQRKKGVTWDKTEALFRAYLADGYKDPPIMRHEGPSGFKMTAPWEQLLKVRLVMAGFSETEALNGYLPGRWYDYFTVCELRQTESGRDPKNFRPVFYTRELSEQLKACDSALREAGNG